MGNIVAILVASSQMLYQAQVASFGCNTSAAISQLQQSRENANALGGLLSEKVLQGDCVEFMKGSVVEGTVDDTDPSVLRVQTRLDPPGYFVPSADFKLKDVGDQGAKK